MGRCLERKPDGFKHTVEFAIHFIISEPQHPISQFLKNAIALVVAPAVFIEPVLVPVHLDDDARTPTFKIDDMICQRRLAPEVMAYRA